MIEIEIDKTLPIHINMFKPIRRCSSHPWLRKSWPLEETLVIITNLCRSWRLPDQECLHCSLQQLIALDWPSCWGYYAECAWAKGNHPWPMASACFMVLHAPSSGYTLTLRHTFGNTWYSSGYIHLGTFEYLLSYTPASISFLHASSWLSPVIPMCALAHSQNSLSSITLWSYVSEEPFALLKSPVIPMHLICTQENCLNALMQSTICTEKKLQQQELALKKLWRWDL